MKQFFSYLLDKKWIIFCILITLFQIELVRSGFEFIKTYDPTVLNWIDPQSNASGVYWVTMVFYLILAFFTKFRFPVLYFALVIFPWLPIPRVGVEANLYLSIVFPILFWLGIPQKVLFSKSDLLILVIWLIGQCIVWALGSYWSPLLMPFMLINLLPIFYIYKINQDSAWLQKLITKSKEFFKTLKSK